MFFLSRMLLNVRRDSRSGRIYVFFQSVTAFPVAGTLPQKGLMQIKDWKKIRKYLDTYYEGALWCNLFHCFSDMNAFLWQGSSSGKRLVDVLVFLLYGYGCTPHPSMGHISFLTGDQSHIKIYSI